MTINPIKDFFSFGSRSGKIKKNLLISVICKFFSILISFVMVPITLDYLDATRYGLWAALSTVIAWFFIFDIGIGNGLRNKFTESKAKGDFSQIRYYVSSAYFYFTGLVFIAIVIFLVANYFIDWSALLNAPKDMKQEISIIATIVFTGMSIGFVLKIINFILMADLKTATNDVLGLIAQLLTLLGIILLTKFTVPSLLNFAVMYIGVNLIVTIVSTFFFSVHGTSFSFQVLNI